MDTIQFPSNLLYLVEHDVWARLEAGGQATVGITALGIKLSGEIYMCRAKSLGSRVEQGRALAVVELAKAIVSVKSPLSGEVIELNPLLEDSPEWVHLDPYGRGWVARLQPTALAQDLERLAEGEAVQAMMTDRLRHLERDK